MSDAAPPGDSSDLAIRRLLLIPHLPVGVSDGVAASPVIRTMRALSPFRKGSPHRKEDLVGSTVRGTPVVDYSVINRGGTPNRAMVPKDSFLFQSGTRNESPMRGTKNTSGVLMELMGPPQLQLSRGVASSISAYKPTGIALSQGNASFAAHRGMENILGEGGRRLSVADRPPTPVTPSIVRASRIGKDGSIPPTTHRYLIGKEGERALREAPLLCASIAKAKQSTDTEYLSTAAHRHLIQRGPEDWFRRRALHQKIRFRIAAPQLLMYPLLFPTVASATTYAPSNSPMLSLSKLICETTADDLIQLAATAVREHLVSPVLLAAGGVSSDADSILRELTAKPANTADSAYWGPSQKAIEEQVMAPFRPFMEALRHENACSSLAVAWPLEKPEVSSLAAHIHGSIHVDHDFPSKESHTIIYLQGPHSLSSFPLISAWSRSMLLAKEKSQTAIVDIFLVVKS